MSTATAPIDTPIKECDEIRVAQAACKIYRGAAVGAVFGTGYATVLLIATAAMKFLGVAEETNDNTLGTPGTPVYGNPGSQLSPYIRIKRRGIVTFNQTGFTQASVGQKCYFSDDNTVTLTPGVILAGEVVTVNESSSLAEVDITQAVFTQSQEGWIALAGTTDAIPPHSSASYVVTGAAVDAMTLAAPTATTDDGKTLIVSSNTAYAHTLTATGLLQTGASAVNVATFAAHAGATVTLKAYQGKWNVISSTGITLS